VSLVERVHERFVRGRRVEILAEVVGGLVPRGARVLDVGAGDGALAARLLAARPDLAIEGIDVLVRENAAISVHAFDGRTIPHPDDSFDAALLVDVVHHAEAQVELLREAARVAPAVVIKDHLREGFLAGPTLGFMDRVGNVRHGVDVRYAYLTTEDWRRALAEAGLTVAEWRSPLRLYPFPATLAFDRGLHFAARAERPPR
jgi:SAM-dependent methyltransferase